MTTAPKMAFNSTFSAILETLSVPRWLLVIILVIIYFVSITLHRLYLSPLAAIPGPKLAALTHLYGMYHDIYRGGQYIWVVEDMHKCYGPIVRIRPDAVHINDPEFLDQVYGVAGARREKSIHHCNSLMVPDSFVATSDHELHRRRRSPMNQYFSKQSVRRLEPILHRTLSAVLSRMDTFGATAVPCRTNALFSAATSDIISEYAFGSCWNSLAKEDLNEDFFNFISDGSRMWHVSSYFPWIVQGISSLPLKLAVWVYPRMKVVIPLFGMLRDNIDRTRDMIDSKDTQPSLIGAVLDSDLPETEKSTDRLLRESQVLISAGTDTTASILSISIFHLLSNPERLKKLKAELKTAIPDPRAMPSSLQVENLPYLTAIIKETIRLQSPGCMRQERVAPDDDLIYEYDNKQYLLPRGTVMAMTATLLSRNETLYPSANLWLPERFIESSLLDKFSLAFSRGSRICLGINLAYAELYIMLAGIFRKYDLYDGTGTQSSPTLELFETTQDDIAHHADFAVPWPKNRVQIMVR